MFFEHFRERLSSLVQKKSDASPKTSPSAWLKQNKADAERLTLEKTDKLISEKKYNLALKTINQTIESGISTNQIIHKKALVLSKTKQFQEAHAIWTQLSTLTKKPKLAASAKQLLEKSKEVERHTNNSIRELIDDLHTEASLFNIQLENIPKSNNWTPKVDLIPLVIKQAEILRIAELPKLSTILIDRTLKAGLESPLLLKEKAQAIAIMGQRSSALELLGEVQRSIKNKELLNLINKNINEIQSNASLHRHKTNLYLTKQARAIAAANKLGTTFLPEDKEIKQSTNIKFLIFRKARAILPENPQACLNLVDSILDYYPGDLAALLLKGETLAALGEDDAAVKVLANLTHSKENNIAQKASELLGDFFTKQALLICTKNSPKEALLYFIEQQLNCDVIPLMTEELKTILKQLNPTENNQNMNDELQQHQLPLTFNMQLIECLEAKHLRRNDHNQTT